MRQLAQIKEFVRVTTRRPRLFVRHIVNLSSSSFYRNLQKWTRDKGDEIARLDYQLNKDSVVLDLGGYLGDWAQAISDKFDSTIYVFEPVKRFVEKMEHRFVDRKKIHLYAYGLGGKNEKLEIAVANESSSVFLSGAEKEMIRIRSIGETLRDLHIGHIDLIKINIEGGEYGLLDQLIETGDIHKIDSLQIQFHLFVPGARKWYKAIAQKLAQTHELTWSYPFVWENWQRRKDLPIKT